MTKTLRQTLLNQDAGAPAGVEDLLNLSLAEDRRVRRLVIWTTVLWLTWFVVLGLGIAIPMAMRANAQRELAESARKQAMIEEILAREAAEANAKAGNAANPSAQAQTPTPQPALAPPRQAQIPPSQTGTAASPALLIGAVMLYVIILMLPVGGIILLIVLFFTRRSASITQLRMGLARVEEQLKALAAERGAGGKGTQGSAS